MRPLARLAALAVSCMPIAAVAASPAAWTVDRGASTLRFSSSMAGRGFTGVFRRWAADIRFDPADPAASSVTAVIDVGSAVTGDADRDQALPTDAFLDARAHPEASFVAHGFVPLGPGRYAARGVLTPRGVSKPLTLPFTLEGSGPRARMTASLAINRLAFGVGQGEWSATTTIPAAVTVTISLLASRVP